MKLYPARSTVSTPADPTCFTGAVWRTEHLPRIGDGLVGHRFLYAPGARSHWHVHDGEQAIVVIEGRGLVHWSGLEETKRLLPGDWLHVDPGVEHWHGAVVDDVFGHLAVTASGATHWLGAVSDADYLQGQTSITEAYGQSQR
jgi:quercetin dioxygenase-like cupin family protein